MKKIYLILAHKNPQQLERQINSLSDGQSFFYVHIDLKTDISGFLAMNFGGNVCLIKERVDCIWGDFSTIIATLNLIENATKNHKDGVCILMSGSDYPIKSNSNINSYLIKNSDKVFMEIYEAEDAWPTFNERIDYYKVNFSSQRNDFILLKGINQQTLDCFTMGKISFSRFMRISFKKREINLKIKFYGGSQWWAMSTQILIKMNDYIKSNKFTLFRFFNDSLLPDEFFFHSIIMHMKKTDDSITIEPPLTYVNWVRKNCQLPVTFSIGDLGELIEQPEQKLFARKFDIDYDKNILDQIDNLVS